MHDHVGVLVAATLCSLLACGQGSQDSAPTTKSAPQPASEPAPAVAAAEGADDTDSPETSGITVKRLSGTDKAPATGGQEAGGPPATGLHLLLRSRAAV